MMTGHRTTWKAGKINYKVLRKINPEAARLAVIEYLSTGSSPGLRSHRVSEKMVFLDQKKSY